MDVEEKVKTLVRDLSPNSPEYKRYIQGIVTRGLRYQHQAEASKMLDKQLVGILTEI